jgi:hypothetical protein
MTNDEKETVVQLYGGRGFGMEDVVIKHKGRSNSFGIYEGTKLTNNNIKNDFGIVKGGFLKLYD